MAAVRYRQTDVGPMFQQRCARFIVVDHAARAKCVVKQQADGFALGLAARFRPIGVDADDQQGDIVECQRFDHFRARVERVCLRSRLR